MHIFYTPDIKGGVYELSEEESKHCIRVLRLNTGDEVRLVDGAGGMYLARIIAPNAKATLLEVVSAEKQYHKRNHYLHLAVAPTKNIERIEWLLEKATEIGVDEITPILCQRSERKEIKIERLNKVITSAVKQSIKAYHPSLNPITPFASFVNAQEDGQKFIAHCMEGDKKRLKDDLVRFSKYTVMIGPEGDFSTSEVQLALQCGFNAISLGKSRLRTETAALQACFELNYLNSI